MKNLKEVYYFLKESFGNNISKSSEQEMIHKADDAISLDYRDVLICILMKIRKKRNWNQPSISLRERDVVYIQLHNDTKGRLREIGWDTYGVGLNFQTGASIYPESEVVDYNPKEIFDALNWDDIEWKHRFTKKEFLSEYTSNK